MRGTGILRRLLNLTVVKAALMIAGTAIGAGMLGIPLVTAETGFVSGAVITFLVWIYMFLTGIFLMEVSVSLKENGGFLEMAGKYLPFFGKGVMATLFIFLYGILLVAYISAGAQIFSIYLGDNLLVKAFFPMMLFGVLCFRSNRVITIISILTIPMWIYFVVFYFIGAEHIQIERLFEGDYTKAYLAVPILFGAFGYHNVIPSVAKYLDYHRKNLRVAILFGSLIPCLLYILWQGLILGIASTETLALAKAKGVPIVALLGEVTGNSVSKNSGAIFAFFAIITSALGVGLSVVHFIDKEHRKVTNLFVIFFPAMIAFINPAIFLSALSFAGGFGESILNGIIPIWMFVVYKSSLGQLGAKMKIFSFFLFLIALFVIIIELCNLI